MSITHAEIGIYWCFTKAFGLRTLVLSSRHIVMSLKHRCAAHASSNGTIAKCSKIICMTLK